MSFELLESGGVPVEGGRNLGIYVYPNETRDRAAARHDVGPSVHTACTQLLDQGALDSYEIDLYTGEAGVEYVDGDEQAERYFHNFKSWIDDHHGARRGVHLGVTGHTNFANAEYVARGETAWVANTKAFVGTAGGYDETTEDVARYRNLAVQEPLHNMICSEYTDVNSLMAGDEHDLGTIVPDDSNRGPSTPMLTYYERDDTHPSRRHDRSGKGVCANAQATWDGTHTLTLTRCTVDAVERTAARETTSR